MILVTDQLQRVIQLPHPPQRIVSTVPSQTELLYDLGLQEAVTGITKFCVHPPAWKKSKTIIGGTKNLNLQKIQALQPDLIIANKEENLQAEIETLAKDFPVFISDVHNLDTALDMIEKVGILTGKTETAQQLTLSIQTTFNELNVYKTPRKVAYLIWQNPYMTIGGDTFIHDMLQRCGFINVFAGQTRYPEITLAALQQSGAELVLLSSEPYPFGAKHVAELQALLPDTSVRLVDGEFFSWYGSRLSQAPIYFMELLKDLRG